MRIVGHGIDIVDLHRIERMISDHPERFVSRCFTEAERAYCEAGGQRRIERYAARFAAKEAAFKAVGTGWRSGIAWTDAGVVHDPAGAPRLVVTGGLARRAAQARVSRWFVSLSHSGSAAIASVIAVEDLPPHTPDG